MMARKVGWVVLAVACLLLWVGCEPAVQAPVRHEQDRPRVQEKAEPKVMRTVKLDDDSLRARLLFLGTVQKDLSLTDAQIAEISGWSKAANNEFREMAKKMREVLPPGQHMTEEEAERRQRESRALIKDMKSRQKGMVVKVLAILTPSQSERLKQIQLQASISAALARPEIIKVLGLSERQRAKICRLCDRTEKKELAAIPDLHGVNAEQRRQRMIEYMKTSHEFWAEAKGPILDVLTPAQRAKFQLLQGREVDLTWPYNELLPEDVDF
jgi:hypothetical protein